MRSQVQVLAGPPPVPAGHSAASEPGTRAAGLGRAGAARPSPPAPPVAPPGPPTRTSGSATTTHRGRAPSRGRQPRVSCSHLALQPAPNPAARIRHRPPLTNATSAASPASRPPGPSIEPSTARQPQGPPPVPVVTVARPPRPGPQRHRLSMGGYGRVRTDGADTRRLDTGRVDSRRPDRRTPGRRTQVTGHQTGWTPDGWTAGSRTTTPDGWTPMLDTDRRPMPWRASWQCRPPATTPDRWMPAGRSAVQSPSGRATTRTAQQQGLRGHHAATDRPGYRRDSQLQVMRRRPAGASAHCSPWTITGRG
jgi:hypothetical protein